MNHLWLAPFMTLFPLLIGAATLVLLRRTLSGERLSRFALSVAGLSTATSSLASIAWFAYRAASPLAGGGDRFARLIRWNPLTPAWCMLLCFLLLLGVCLVAFEVREARERSRLLLLFLIAGFGLLSVSITNHLLVLVAAWPLASLPLSVAAFTYKKSNRHSLALIATFLADFLGFILLAFAVTLFFAQFQELGMESLSESVRSDIETSDILLYTGMSLWLAALFTRLAIFPFHIVTAERVLIGPLAIGGLASLLLPISATAAAWSFVGDTLHPLLPQWQTFLAWMGLITTWGGALGMVVQKGTRSFLASSLILQGGWTLLLIANPSSVPVEAESYFLWFSTSLSLFILLFGAAIMEKNVGTHSTSGLAGLFQYKPRLAWAMLTAYLSLACIPFTSGFAAKAMVLGRLVSRDTPLLAVVAALAIVVSAIPCLKAVGVMASKAPRTEKWPEPSLGATLLLWWLSIGIWALGLFPATVWPG